MSLFHGVVGRLEADGFCVACDPAWSGLKLWPWHTDALVFAARHV